MIQSTPEVSLFYRYKISGHDMYIFDELTHYI